MLGYRVTRMWTRLQREAYNLIEYKLQLKQTLSENKQRRKNKWHDITMTKQTMTQQTKDHRQLHHTDNSMRKLMSRKVQWSIWILKMRCPTYPQVTPGQPLRCRWCDENYNSITKHWLRHCQAMIYWEELMKARLTEYEAFLDDGEKQLQYSIHRTQ